MILTVDIGNTNITCGLYENDSPARLFRLESGRNFSSDYYTELFKAEIVPQNIEGAIVGSVVTELNDRVISAIENVCEVKPVIVSDRLNMPLKINVKSPSGVGADRIANAVKAWQLYKSPVIVVDLGTATTFDVVNSKGEYIGGLIAPGIKTQLSSLNISTSLLSEVDIKPSEKAIGNDTESCILSGVLRGSAAMIEGMLKKTEEELGEKAITIGTGGLCKFASEYMTENFDYILPNLTMDGLYELYQLNKKELLTGSV